MTWIWTLPAILTVSLAGVFYPVFTRRGNLPLPPGLEGDPRKELMSQRDGILMQLKELEWHATPADLGDTTLRTELEQELALILTRLDTLVPGHVPPSPTVEARRNSVGIAIAFSAMFLVAMLSGGLYLFLGTPQEIAPATAPQHAIPAEFVAMVEQAAKKLQETPDDLEGWMRLARSYGVLKRPNDAMAAYTHILSRYPEEIEAAVGLSELQLQSQNTQLHAQAIQRFETILAKQPNRPEALWFLGGAAFRAGDRTKALSYWKRLKPLLSPGSTAFKTVEQAIQEAEKQ